MNLKPLDLDGSYDQSVCAVDECAGVADIIDGTRVLADVDVPLCWDCWEVMCDDDT